MTELTGQDLLQITYAAINGTPNPVEGEEAQRIYDKVVEEVQADPDAQWDAPKIT